MSAEPPRGWMPEIKIGAILWPVSWVLLWIGCGRTIFLTVFILSYALMLTGLWRGMPNDDGSYY